MKRKNSNGITLFEIIVATLILFTVSFITFEIIISSYGHMTKMKCLGRLMVLTQSKMENLLFINPVASSGWEKFSEQSEYIYKVDVEIINVPYEDFYYRLKKVTIEAKGPENRKNIPEFQFSLTNYALYSEQSITSEKDDTWGKGLTHEVDLR